MEYDRIDEIDVVKDQEEYFGLLLEKDILYQFRSINQARAQLLDETKKTLRSLYNERIHQQHGVRSSDLRYNQQF